jgi:tetratricopeptide (TPR) repeat protein
MKSASNPACRIALPALLAACASWQCPAQQAKSAPVATGHSKSVVEHGIELVESGHCSEALPILKRALLTISDKTEKRSAQMGLVRCAMALDEEKTAVDALMQLRRDAPDDPEILYIETHYFSELGMRAAKELQAVAPDSVQEQRLEAETLESQGKNDEAVAIYNKILAANPKTSGIHYKLGQIDLDKAGPDGPTDDARREFEKEIEIDPGNASAQFILGELARRAANWEEAIQRFSSAAKLDAGFSEAYLALGMSLGASGDYARATAPLEKYVKMQPEDPAGHYQLALAYFRTGNKEGASRETALQQKAEQARAALDSTEGHAVHP